MQELLRLSVDEHFIALLSPYEATDKRRYTVRVMDKDEKVLREEHVKMTEFPITARVCPEDAKAIEETIDRLRKEMGLLGEPKLVPPKMKDTIISEAEIYRLPHTYPHYSFIIVLGLREGAGPFVQEMEFTLYPPTNEAASEEFMFIAVEWPPGDMMLPWFVLGVPTKDLERVKEIASKYKFILRDGVLPVMSASNQYTLEGGLDSKNKEEAHKLGELKSHVEALVARHQRKLKDEAAQTKKK